MLSQYSLAPSFPLRVPAAEFCHLLPPQADRRSSAAGPAAGRPSASSPAAGLRLNATLPSHANARISRHVQSQAAEKSKENPSPGTRGPEGGLVHPIPTPSLRTLLAGLTFPSPHVPRAMFSRWGFPIHGALKHGD